MPFTNQVIFSSREFRPPEKLKMANLLSDEPTTNSILPKVKKFEAEQRRLLSQFEVREFCDNLVEGVVKALKDVSKIQKKSTTTRASIAKPSLFINEKPKGKSENNLEDLKDFSDYLPIFDEYEEELIESLIICEDNCDLPFPEPDFMFDKEQTIAEQSFLQPEHPSSLVLFSQDFEENPFDYPHQGPLLDTRRPLDDGLGRIFDEEDELGPTFDEKIPSITSINMENLLCFDPGTTPTPLTTYIQENYKKLDLINFLSEMCVKISSQDVKRFGFDKFLKHSKGFDHFEESLELDLQQHDFCSRNTNCAITYPGTILVYNTYFDRLHDDLKRVLHVLGKETLDQSPRGVRNISRDHAYKFEIWRWKYLRKTTSKLQGSKCDLRSNPFQERGNDVPLGSAPGKTDMHGFIMGGSKDICSLFES
uniref:Uncharacterized protein n=1 Tax=Brassica oleracea var. oleracea TaxID=109376 RepID=A0A0D3CEN4_BRAOL